MSVGLEICGDILHPHYDPHKHLMHESEWTYMAVITATEEYNPFPLPCKSKCFSLNLSFPKLKLNEIV